MARAAVLLLLLLPLLLALALAWPAAAARGIIGGTGAADGETDRTRRTSGGGGGDGAGGKGVVGLALPGGRAGEEAVGWPVGPPGGGGGGSGDWPSGPPGGGGDWPSGPPGGDDDKKKKKKKRHHHGKKKGGGKDAKPSAPDCSQSHTKEACRTAGSRDAPCTWCKNKGSPFPGSDGVCLEATKTHDLPPMVYDCGKRPRTREEENMIEATY